jgi:hypothetical protein
LEIIYCADGNPRFAEIAIKAGFLYGAQLPNTALSEYRPCIASVIDWEEPGQLGEVLQWAEEAARFVEVVMLIPKVIGGIERLPRAVGGKPVRLGYSVPTKFGGTPVPVWEFQGWPVHLLGGSPRSQFRLAHYLNPVSVDGNYSQLMAVKYNAYFTLRRVPGARNHPWPTLKEASGGAAWGDGSATADAPYEAFRRSCQNIMEMWSRLR